MQAPERIFGCGMRMQHLAPIAGKTVRTKGGGIKAPRQEPAFIAMGFGRDLESPG